MASSSSGGGAAEGNSSELPEVEVASAVPGSGESDETEDLCCMCHNGGSLISCEGPCRRAFHPNTDEEGADNCNTLDMSDEELEFYCDSNEPFLCGNCRYGKLQCFSCKELGLWKTACKKRKRGSLQELFQCVEPGCNKFYHRHCSPARCGRHKCHVCDVVTEDKSNPLVPCRLCEKAWHKECLDPDINFEEGSKYQRGWKIMDLDDKEILDMFIFCRDHQAPSRTARFNPSDLVVFPFESPQLKAERRLQMRQKKWECKVCGKVGCLTLQDRYVDVVLAMCKLCGVEYLVYTSQKGLRRCNAKFGGRVSITKRAPRASELGGKSGV